MKKKILFFLLFLLTAVVAEAQNPELVVSRFGQNLQSWTATGSFRYHKEIVRLSDGEKKVRVSDELSALLFRKYNYPSTSNELNSYLNCIEKEMSRGIRIVCSNIRRVNLTDVSSYNTRDLEFVSCDITVSSKDFSQSFKNLFYVRKDKISKIDKYQVEKDSRGRHKIKIDLSDIDFDDETFGITYNYSRHFPVGASFNYGMPWFMVGVDLGVTFDDRTYLVDKVSMTDIMNYERTRMELKPKFFLTATPALNLKYVAIGCGVGFLYFSGNEETFRTNESGTATVSANSEKIKWMLRPSVRGYIPVDRYWGVSLSVGYDYVIGYKDMNGISFGLGAQFSL